MAAGRPPVAKPREDRAGREGSTRASLDALETASAGGRARRCVRAEIEAERRLAAGPGPTGRRSTASLDRLRRRRRSRRLGDNAEPWLPRQLAERYPLSRSAPRSISACAPVRPHRRRVARRLGRWMRAPPLGCARRPPTRTCRRPRGELVVRLSRQARCDRPSVVDGVRARFPARASPPRTGNRPGEGRERPYAPDRQRPRDGRGSALTGTNLRLLADATLLDLAADRSRTVKRASWLANDTHVYLYAAAGPGRRKPPHRPARPSPTACRAPRPRRHG